MSKKVKANRILEKWKVDFIKMDKKRESIRENFDELFYSLYIASVPYDMARDIVDDAVAHSLPSASTAKYVWNIKKAYVKIPYREWLDGWKTDIRNKALAAYYELYPVEEEDPIPPPQVKQISKPSSGMATDDELNEEDFYKSSKKVTRENPFFFPKRGEQ